MTSGHRLIAIVLVWLALGGAAVVANSSSSAWLMAGQWVVTVNGAYLVAALTATVLILRAPAPGR